MSLYLIDSNPVERVNVREIDFGRASIWTPPEIGLLKRSRATVARSSWPETTAKF